MTAIGPLQAHVESLAAATATLRGALASAVGVAACAVLTARAIARMKSWGGRLDPNNSLLLVP